MTAPTTPAPTSPTPPRQAAPPPAAGDGARPQQSPRRPLGVGILLIGLGVLWLLALLDVPLRWELVLPGAIIAIGLLLVALPRSAGRDGLVGLGIALAVIALIFTVQPRTVAGSAGERVHTIADIADLDADYRLGAGKMIIDLRDLELTADVTELTASVGMGELVVRAPEGVTVIGEARTGLGEVAAFGASQGGIGPDVTLEEDAGADAPVLDLDLQVGMGRIEVTSAR